MVKFQSKTLTYLWLLGTYESGRQEIFECRRSRRVTILSFTLITALLISEDPSPSPPSSPVPSSPSSMLASLPWKEKVRLIFKRWWHKVKVLTHPCNQRSKWYLYSTFKWDNLNLGLSIEIETLSIMSNTEKISSNKILRSLVKSLFVCLLELSGLFIVQVHMI